MSDSSQPISPPTAPRKSKWKRILLILLTVLVVCLALLFGCVYVATKPVVNAADTFFSATAQQGPDASYALASPAFRSSTPLQTWANFARNNALSTYQSASWTSREVANGTAELKGSLHLQGGASIPLAVELAHGLDGSWRVLSIHFATAGIDQQTQSAPSMMTNEIDATPGAPGGEGVSVTNTAPGGLPGISAGPAPQAPPVGVPTPGSFQSAQPTANASGLEAMMVPAAKVAGICQQTFAEQYRLAFSGTECFQGLSTAPGGSTRCTTTDPRTGARVGFTAIDQRFDPVSQHVDVSCVLDTP